MSLRVVLIDDEQHARENLQLLLNEYCPQVEVMGTAHDVDSGLEAIKTHAPQAIFLDIRMPSGSEGFELLRASENKDFMVVFVTAFKDYAIDAFKVNAVDYVLKPIDIDELINTVDRLMDRVARFQNHEGEAQAYRNNLDKLSREMLRASERITINHSQGVKLVRVKDICFLKAEGNCTRLLFKDGSQFLDTRTLKVYEEELALHPFFRVHRSYVINLEELEEFIRTDGRQVRLRSGHTLPVARAAVSDLLERMAAL